MFYSEQDSTLGHLLAPQLAGHDQLRDVRQALEELPKQRLCRSLVAPTLDENIRYVAVLVEGTPQIAICTVDGRKHLTQLLCVSRPGTAV